MSNFLSVDGSIKGDHLTEFCVQDMKTMLELFLTLNTLSLQAVSYDRIHFLPSLFVLLSSPPEIPTDTTSRHTGLAVTQSSGQTHCALSIEVNLQSSSNCPFLY